MRKLGLIAAALMTGFVFHAAFAADAAVPAADDAAAVVCPCGNDQCPWAQGEGQGRGPGFGGRGMGMRQGWHGRPMMHHRGEMMRQGWRNWNDNDDRNDDRDDSRRGRRFGRGMGMRQGFGPGVQQRFGGMRQGQGFGMMPRFMDELNLTDAQRKQMIDIATENFRERLTLRWEMEKARKTLEELNDAETPDYDAIVAANEALGAAEGKLDVAGRQVRGRFAAVLTEEQKAVIEEYRNEQADDEEEDTNE